MHVTYARTGGGLPEEDVAGLALVDPLHERHRLQAQRTQRFLVRRLVLYKDNDDET